MKRGMSNHVTKLIVLINFLLLSACNQQEQKNHERNRKILELSQATIGSQEYDRIYQQTLDSLSIWCSEKLPGYESIWSFSYRLDSVLCFNKEKDRMVTAILGRHNRSDCVTDDVHYFYGAKIKGQWYFFRGGGTMVILRRNYQKDIHTPISFEKLHELAMEEMFRGYVKKNKAGIWEINDAFFTANFEDVGWGDFNKQTHKDTVARGKRFTNKREYFESIYLDVAKGIWLKPEKKTSQFQR